jgi:prepilin-type processing-associated H-X9-DG protein
MTKRIVIECSLGLLLLLMVRAFIYAALEEGRPVARRGSIAAENLQQIANAYATYSNSTEPPRSLQLPPGSTVHDAAFILAKYTGLNDASVWYTFSDNSSANPSFPRSVIAGNISTATGPAPNFVNVPLMVVFAANVSPLAPSNTTPIAWERGLQANGTWSADSPYQGQGGHIAFLDGHVEWYDKLNADDPTSSLVKYGTNISTANIAEALPPGAVILSAEPWHAAK